MLPEGSRISASPSGGEARLAQAASQVAHLQSIGDFAPNPTSPRATATNTIPSFP
jgi:hypothetical protein